MAEIRWCFFDNSSGWEVCSEPTTTDLIDLANKRLKDDDEFKCCKNCPPKNIDNVKTLLNTLNEDELKSHNDNFEHTIELEITISPGTSTAEEIKELYNALDHLHRACGGYGILIKDRE